MSEQTPTVAPARVKRVFDKYIANKKLVEKKQPYVERIATCEKYKTLIKNGFEIGQDGEHIDLTDGAIKEYKDFIKKYEKDESNIKETLKEISKNKIRFNKKVFTFIAAISDRIVEELATHALNNNISAADKKTLKETNIFTEGVEETIAFKLLRDLPSWNKKEPAADEELEQEQHSESDIAFNIYVDKIIKLIKEKNDEFIPISISKTFKSAISDLLVEFCNKLFNISYIIIQLKNQRTITMQIVAAAFKICFSANVCGDGVLQKNNMTIYGFEEDKEYKEFMDKYIVHFLVEEVQTKKIPPAKPKNKRGGGNAGRGKRGGKK